jgi:hypothetical protein
VEDAVKRGTWLWLLALGTGVAWGCAPEVLIARNDAVAGSGGQISSGSAGEAGAEMGADAGGASGEAGTDSGAAGLAEGGASEVPVEPSRLLADSVADFALVQGERGWLYGYDTGSFETFTLLTRQSVITAYVPPSGDVWDCWVTAGPHWTQIFQLGAHPNGTDTSAPSTPTLERAVRRWLSSHAGGIRITGEIAKIDVTIGGSNGVDASIVVDGVQIYTTFIGGEDGGGLSYEVTATVQVGSTVDLVLDPHQGADHHDLSRFTAVIERHQEPVVGEAG